MTSDAPQQVYGVVSYLMEAGVKMVCMVTSGLMIIALKSKVAPLTPMIILRLELIRDIMGLRLTLSVF